MRRKTLGIWVLVALGTLIMGLGNAQQLLTPEQAQDAVRTFENDSNLVFAGCVLKEFTTGPSWNQVKWYSLWQDASGGQRTWRVQAYTAEVQRAVYIDRRPANDTENPVGPRTQQECQTIAENYARSKYTGFDSMGFVINTQEWVGHGWRFTWAQTVQYGARTLNSIAVDVNPVDGLVQEYNAYRFAVVTPAQPQITTQQAIDRAMQEAYLVTQTSLTGPVLWTDPDGGILYVAIVAGVDVLGEEHEWSVCLNALDGSLCRKEMASGGMSRDRVVKYMNKLETKKTLTAKKAMLRNSSKPAKSSAVKPKTETASSKAK